MRMMSYLELNSRAALCRQLALREPNSKAYWLAEAENWSRLSRESGRALTGRPTLAGYCSRGILGLCDGLDVEGEGAQQP
jgi:hypothetical protein